MATENFDPNRARFAECVARVREAAKASGIEPRSGIITSRDEGVRELTNALRTDNVPDGFQKWQLPFWLDKSSTMFLTVAEPGAYAPPHAHEEGDGVRFIVSGSIKYEGKELTAGDWMYMPAGSKYSFEAGALGAVIVYCYEC